MSVEYSTLSPLGGSTEKCVDTTHDGNHSANVERLCKCITSSIGLGREEGGRGRRREREEEGGGGRRREGEGGGREREEEGEGGGREREEEGEGGGRGRRERDEGERGRERDEGEREGGRGMREREGGRGMREREGGRGRMNILTLDYSTPHWFVICKSNEEFHTHT